LWLNIRLIHGTGIVGIDDLLFKTADHSIERAADEQIRGGIVIARLRKLPVGGSAGEIPKAQGSSKDDKG
jgi:hypothetical protein